jgi:N-acyl-D-amino-acid deacylase
MTCGRALLAAGLLLVAGCSPTPEYDLVIRGGLVVDGSGAPPVIADVAIVGDSIAAVGESLECVARKEIDATGLAVAPGFINMLSWANESLLHDGRSQSDIRQGVTLEVLGEGFSMGPLTEAMKQEMLKRQGAITYPVTWTTLGEYLDTLERQGISTNVASFVGAATARIHVLGYDDRAPSKEELLKMQALVHQAMREGAVGVSSSLIYAPAVYAATDELIALARTAAEDGGMYASHIRSEGNHLLEAVEEFLTVVRQAGARGEIYHLKAAGANNWEKLDSVIARIERARADGLEVTADMYVYTAAATGMDAMMPPWVLEGGFDRWVERLKNPAVRARLVREISDSNASWENFYTAAATPHNIRAIGFKADSLKKYTGKSLAEIASRRGTTPVETIMDLVVQDNSSVEAVYFLMSEHNIEKEIALPWMSFCSDAGSYAPEGVFLEFSVHPRAYGNFARLLMRYVNQRGIITLEEAIRRLSALPAHNLRLHRRGTLQPGNYADVVVFYPRGVRDYATYEQPHRYARGMVHVFVNGVQVLKDGEHTGKTPGRVVRGPGYTGTRPR